MASKKRCYFLSKKVRNIITQESFVIVGCGGVGSLIAEMLVRTGCKKLVLVDGDDVEEHNLNISTYYHRDCERKKVECLAQKLSQINGDVQTKKYPLHFKTREDWHRF